MIKELEEKLQKEQELNEEHTEIQSIIDHFERYQRELSEKMKGK